MNELGILCQYIIELYPTASEMSLLSLFFIMFGNGFNWAADVVVTSATNLLLKNGIPPHSSSPHSSLNGVCIVSPSGDKQYNISECDMDVISCELQRGKSLLKNQKFSKNLWLILLLDK